VAAAARRDVEFGRRLGDDRGDPAGAQARADGPRGVEAPSVDELMDLHGRGVVMRAAMVASTDA
jgi:hypothetical protein